MTKAKWPTRWLMTDERLGDALWTAIGKLPIGGGLVFRHHTLPEDERRHLGERIARLAEDRGLVLAVSRDERLAKHLRARIVHNIAAHATMPFSRSVHSLADARAATGASLAFVSPVAPTRSHPDARPLDPTALRAILAGLDCPAIALGGMNDARFATLGELGFYGWAGIDAWR